MSPEYLRIRKALSDYIVCCRDDVSARYIRIQGRIKKFLRIDIDQCNGAGKLILSS